MLLRGTERRKNLGLWSRVDVGERRNIISVRYLYTERNPLSHLSVDHRLSLLYVRTFTCFGHVECIDCSRMADYWRMLFEHWGKFCWIFQHFLYVHLWTCQNVPPEFCFLATIFKIFSEIGIFCGQETNDHFAWHVVSINHFIGQHFPCRHIWSAVFLSYLCYVGSLQSGRYNNLNTSNHLKT